MLSNFQLAAIVRTGTGTQLLRIPLHQRLQNALARSWDEQYVAFTAGVREVPFNAGYRPEPGEQFRLQPFEVPPWLEGMTSLSATNLDPISADDSLLDATRGIAAFARSSTGQEVVLFQNFNRAHVIRPGSFLLLRNDTFETSDRPGLTLDRKLSAVYVPEERKLLFHSFRTVNTFIPLADLYREASEEDVREVLAHNKLAPEDTDALATDPSQWLRKRFAMLRDSGVLDRYSAKAIKARAKGYPITIQVTKDRIVFPAERSAAKRLLQFLNEELYRGPITDTVFETNSKAPATV